MQTVNIDTDAAEADLSRRIVASSLSPNTLLRTR